MPIGGVTHKRKNKPAANKLMRILEEIERPFIGPGAGVAQELKRRNIGLAPRPMLKAMKEGFTGRLTYFDVIEDTEKALVMSIALSPFTYATPAAVAKIPGAVALASKATKTAKAFSSFSETVPVIGQHIRTLKIGVGTALLPHFREGKLFGKAHSEVIRELGHQRQKQIDIFRLRAGELHDEILKAVPSKEERELATQLYERTVPLSSAQVPDDVVKGFYDLSKEGQTAMRLLWKLRQEFEIAKEEVGLTRAAMDGFLKKHRINYIARRESTRKGMVSYAKSQADLLEDVDLSGKGVKRLLQAADKGDEEALDILEALEQGSRSDHLDVAEKLGNMRDAPEPITGDEFARRFGITPTFAHKRVAGTFDQTIDGIMDEYRIAASERNLVKEMIRNAPVEGAIPKEVYDQYRALSITAKEAVKDGWRFRGGRSMTADEVVDANVREVTLDMADLLGQESVEIGIAKANKEYFEALAGHLEDFGLAIPANKIDDGVFAEAHFLKILKGQRDISGHSKLEVERAVMEILEEGFDVIDDPALRHLAIPKTLSKDLRKIKGMIDTPEALKGFFKFFKSITDVFKGHVLALFPMFHGRNFVTDGMFNFLDGMGPEDMPHYFAAGRSIYKKLRGVPFSKEGKYMGGMDEHAYWDFVVGERVVGAGWLRGEIGEAIQRTVKPRGVVGKIVFPDSNPAIQGGFIFGQTMEDWHRLAQFNWRLSKGDTPIAAAARVRKWHYDPLYGVTDFEKVAFSNFLFPFYSWYRFNVPLQIKALFTRPGRTLLLPKSIQAIEDEWGGPEPDQALLADWMKRSLMVRFHYNEKTGTYEQFFLNGWIPFADLSALTGREEFAHTVRGLLSPYIKMGFEALENWDIFLEKPIEAFPGQKKRFFKKDIPAKLQQFLRSNRYMRESEKFLFEMESDLPWMSRFWRAIGLKSYPLNPRRQVGWHRYYMSQQKAVLNKHLRREMRRGQDANLKQIENIRQQLRANEAEARRFK